LAEIDNLVLISPLNGKTPLYIFVAHLEEGPRKIMARYNAKILWGFMLGAILNF